MSQLRCRYCGRFIGYNSEYDEYTNWGYAADLEPPDPVLMCMACVEKEKAFYKEQGTVPTYWYNPQWVYELAEELGWVKAGPPGASWGIFFPQDKVPERYTIKWSPKNVQV